MLVRRLQAGVLVALVALASLAAPSSAARREDKVEGPSYYDHFLGDRAKLLETLAPAFVDCFARDSLVDPGSPIFHGCYDWHSAVHAAYSHYVVYRRTNKERYLNLVNEQIAPRASL